MLLIQLQCCVQSLLGFSKCSWIWITQMIYYWNVHCEVNGTYENNLTLSFSNISDHAHMLLITFDWKFLFSVPCFPDPSALCRWRSASLRLRRSSRLTYFSDFRHANRVRAHHSSSSTAQIRWCLNSPGVKYWFVCHVADICGAFRLVSFTLICNVSYFCCL